MIHCTQSLNFACFVIIISSQTLYDILHTVMIALPKYCGYFAFICFCHPEDLNVCRNNALTLLRPLNTVTGFV